MKADVIRVEKGSEGFFGVMLLEGKWFCVTVENAELSIPDGEYICKLYQSPSHGEVWELQDVEGRTHIQIHAANWPGQLLGCIAVGQYPDKLRGNRAVLNSGKTFERFMDVTRNADKLELTVASYVDLGKAEGMNVL